MADHDELTFTMTLNLTVEEVKNLDYAYRTHIAGRKNLSQADTPDYPTTGKQGYSTREEADEYTDTLDYLSSIIENIHIASVQQNMYPSFSVWEDTPQPVLITVERWRTLREALADQLAIYETKYRNGSGVTSTMEYRSLLAKLDTLTLVVHIVEAEETNTTGSPANEVT